MEQFLDIIARNFFWAAITGVAIVAIVGGLIRNILVSSARQKTAREIAAYVAEGSMTPEDAQGILAASKDPGSGGGCRG